MTFKIPLTIKLNLACGKDVRKGWINVDNKRFAGVDKVMDLSKGLKFSNNFADFILCQNFLEHLNNPCDFLKECHRVLKKGGKLELQVPHKNSFLAYHLGHYSFYCSYSFDEFALQEDYVQQEIGSWKVLRNELGLCFRWKNNPLDWIMNYNVWTQRFFDYTPFPHRINVLLEKR